MLNLPQLDYERHDDVVGRDVVAVGSEIGLITGNSFHRLNVSFSDGNINVGCIRLTPEAWSNLRRKVEQVLALRNFSSGDKA